MNPRLTRLAGATIAAVSLAAAALAPAASAAPVSKVTTFTALGRGAKAKVQCGVEIHATNKPATEVLCAAAGVPAPKHGGIGDAGFVQLSVLGQPQTLKLSQDSFVAGPTANLARGRLWNQLGVTCHVSATTVLCFNGDNHGFIIGNGKYKTF
jgi:hypothetical protein